MMRVKIFSCHHQLPDFELSTALYQTLVSGVVLPAGSRGISDLDGRNIAAAEKFCELRHQYYVWQNELFKYDYVGFEHYRRPFYIDPLPLEVLRAQYPSLAALREEIVTGAVKDSIAVGTASFNDFNAMRSGFAPDEREKIQNYILAHDILFTRPIFWPTDDNFRASHSDALEYWHLFMDRINAAMQHQFIQPYVKMPAKWSGYLNMYIMRSDLFSAYMDLLFPVLLALDREFPDAAPRVWGFVAERMLGAFIVQKSMEEPLLRYQSVPHLFHNPAL